MKFKCSCNIHLLEIKKERNKDLKGWYWIGIYDICNPETSTKYKKPKLMADVELDEKESKKLINFIGRVK